MRSITLLLCTCLAVMLCTTAPCAGAAQLDPDQPIDITLRSAGLVETLQSFANISGSELDIDPEVQGKVTIKAHGTPWREVFDSICREHQLNCEILSGEPAVLRVRTTDSAFGAAAHCGYAEGIDLSLKGADLRETLQIFGVIADREVIVDDDVSGSVTIEMQDAPWTVMLEEVCNLSGCHVGWSDTVLRVHAGVEPAKPRLIRQAFDNEPLVDTIATLAQEPVFGALGQPETTIAEGSYQPVTASLEDVNWLEALNTVCEAAECRWQLTYGAPSRLQIKPIDRGPEKTVQLTPGPMSFEKAAHHLATALDLVVDLKSGIDPTAQVSFASEKAIWKDAANHICQQVGCFWRIRDAKLIFRAKVAALSNRPPHGAPDRRITARFFPPNGSAPVEGTARFNWVSPIRTLDSGASDDSKPHRWLARLTWVPFSPEIQIVLPILIDCGTSKTSSAHLLEPVRVPLSEPISRQWHDAILELTAPDESASEAQIDPWGASGCVKAGGEKAQVTFQPLGNRKAASTLELDSRIGTYLLITPPGSERRPQPIAALVALGEDARGNQRVALIKLDANGAEIRIDRKALKPGTQISETLIAPDGREFELTLQTVPD